MSKEQRKFQRHQLHIEVELSFPSGKKQIVRTRDVSQGGVFLMLDRQRHPVIGEVVTLKLGENSHDSSVVFPSTDAIVVRQEEGGIGLAFIELDFAENL